MKKGDYVKVVREFIPDFIGCIGVIKDRSTNSTFNVKLLPPFTFISDNNWTGEDIRVFYDTELELLPPEYFFCKLVDKYYEV